MERFRQGTGMQRMVSSFILWIYILCSLEIKGVISEICVYQRSKYNYLTSSYDKVLTREDCQWGCCRTHNTACCPPPISTIVGIALGGLFGVALVVFLCCYIARRLRQQRQRPHAVLSLRSTQQTSVPTHQARQSEVFHTETNLDLDHYDETYDPPPSYDEVMRGQINYGFKSEAS